MKPPKAYMGADRKHAAAYSGGDGKQQGEPGGMHEDRDFGSNLQPLVRGARWSASAFR